ncbi:isochorismatase family cysteine hydrolase [Spartinivicinus poritis]|uniref:Cysteine hydrolase n=1 Tax=Spartinivicinus poritis TaxID=2994640 RepID=A0ABT5U4U6_9GAMM|nr:isochorismatase family cysteine hydrolase [Spartinivicinus sp. A2-2]MDE1461342.1 cysteine hydrolase [Spartinivicinus sp. A2-2]
MNKEKPDLANSAVVIIDVQSDYISDTRTLLEQQQASLLEQFPHFPDNIRSLLENARKNKVPVIHIREKDNNKKSTWIPWWNKLHPPGNIALGEGSPEPYAKELKNEAVFIKWTYDLFHSIGDEFEAYLKCNNIKRLYMCGVLTKACVMFSANSAFCKGYEVYILEDCCADRNKAHHDAILTIYDGYHIKVINSKNLWESTKITN